MGIDFGKIRLVQFKEDHCLKFNPCEHNGANGDGDCNGCTHPKHPTQRDKEYAEKKANEVHVEAFDEKGNTFDKVVEFEKNGSTLFNKGGTIIHFGGPCSYYVKDLLKNYPLDRNLCIDMCGLNHRGSAVSISKDDINRLLEPYSV